jgi:hypothetical protein
MVKTTTTTPLLLDEEFHRSRLRLLHLERVAYWRGRVSRADLTDTYDISGVQASNDFQRYLAFNPGALQYDLRKKRYFWNPAAQPVLHRPDFGEAVRELLDAEPPAGGAPVAGSEAVRCRRLEYPVREAKLEIQRAFMGAILNGTVLAVRYLSVSSGDHEVREIAPHGFGHDGFRWHARAWCRKNGEYRDFVLARVAAVKTERVLAETLPADTAWTAAAVVTARLNPALPEEVKAGLREEYALDKKDRLRWQTRQALAFYAKRHLASLASPAATDNPCLLAWFVEIAMT